MRVDSLPTRAFFERTDWLSFGAATTSTLAVYWFTLAPQVGLGFSGIFSVAAMYGGVPHPPGYPIWTLWAGAFTKLLPFSNVAWRAGFATAVAGALACGLIALLVSRGGAALFESVRSDDARDLKRQKWIRAVSGCSAGMIFGLNGAFWGKAVIPDPWPLSILQLVIVLCLLRRWCDQPERKRYLYAAFFVYGLTLTNSQIELAFAPAIPFLVMAANRALARDLFLVGSIMFAVFLYGESTSDFLFWGDLFNHYDKIPFRTGLFPIAVSLCVVSGSIGVFLVVKTRRAFTEWKSILICSAALLLGLAFYLYLPIASMTDPPLNWGYPRTVEGFIRVIERGQYNSIMATNDLKTYAGQVFRYGVTAGKEFGWPYLLIAALPLCFLRRLSAPERRWMVGLFAAYVYLAFLILAVINPAVDQTSQHQAKVFYSASYVVLAVWVGYGLIILGNRLTQGTWSARRENEAR